MKRLLIISLLLLSLLPGTAEAGETASEALPADSTASALPDVDYHSPVLAGIFSVVFPGVGHFYNGERAKAWEYMGVTFGSFAAGCVLIASAEKAQDDGDFAMRLLGAGYCIAICSWAILADALDASASAHRINRDGPLVFPEGYKRKSPILAGTFSALVPGAGQIYNGDAERGVRHLMLGAASLLATTASIECSMNASTRGGETLWGTAAYAFGLALLVNTVWSTADAINTANMRNFDAAHTRVETCTVRLTPDLTLNSKPITLGASQTPALSAGLRLSVSF